MKNKYTPVLIVVDLSVRHSSPAGSCILSEIYGLIEKYEVHVFSTEIDEDLERLVQYHPIPAPTSVLVLRYIVFSIRVRKEVRSFLKKCPPGTIVQSTQGQFPDCTVSYPHFSHRAYLNQHWENNPVKGLTRKMRKLNHLYNAKMEARAFQKAEKIVTPSQGLKREISKFYPEVAHKIAVISNPVDVSRFKKPDGYAAATRRSSLGFGEGDIIIGFAALGDFERKGMSILFEAIAKLDSANNPYKILVIGGKTGEIETFRKKAQSLNIGERVVFAGFQKEIERYLWVCDIFSLPSIYEIFPLVAVQAAAAGLPLLVTPLYGVEEYIEEGENGWTVRRDASAIAEVLQQVVAGKYDLVQMGNKALETVTKYDHSTFRKKWLNLFENDLKKV